MTIAKKILCFCLALIVIGQSAVSVSASSDTKDKQIHALLKEACRKSAVPGISVAIVKGDETQYYSSGYSDSNKKIKADQKTIYELASVSKAYTGTAILLLAERNQLSLQDSISHYLPEFELNYQGKPVDMSKITIENLLYHTSGMTNASHTKYIPMGDDEDMLEKTAENLSGTEIDFYPGEQYVYGTVNYALLGRIIEVVSKQSYETFMKNELFEPLNLHQTFAFEREAKKTNHLAQGYRSSFLMTRAHESLPYRGNKPAGYLLSSSEDMAKWMKLQLGQTEEIPEEYQQAIMRSHEDNRSVADVDGNYYAGGWEVHKDGQIIEHSGNNPSFTTQVTLFPQEKIGICVLSNSNTTNVDIVHNIKRIIDGKSSGAYPMGNIRQIDVIFTSVTIAGTLLSVVFFLLGIQRNRKGTKKNRTKKRMLLNTFWILMTLFSLFLCLFLPMLMGIDYKSLWDWEPSILTAFGSFFILNGAILWFVLSVYPWKK